MFIDSYIVMVLKFYLSYIYVGIVLRLTRFYFFQIAPDKSLQENNFFEK